MKYDEYIVLFFVDVIVLNFQPPNAPYGGIFYKELLHEKIITYFCYRIICQTE